MKTIKYSTLMMFIATIFFSCKKYPDGPLISFHSKTKRVAGTYKIVGLYVDGVDSLKQLDTCDFELIFDRKTTSYDNFEMHFQLTNYKSINPLTHQANISWGYWDLVNNKKQIKISQTSNVSPSGSVLPFWYHHSITCFDIIMLKEDEMTLKINHDNKEYLLKLKKIIK